jgi:DNA helicase-4
MIANFLYLNGIKYIYEDKYPYDCGDPYRKQYRPDFYLCKYNIYIEHFGINDKGEVPWLTPIEEKKYLEGIQWKREVHKTNNTTLLETYSYYNKNGVLLTQLYKKLKDKNVEFQSPNYEELFKKIYDKKNDKYFEEFKKLVKSFIGLFKSNGFNEEQFEILKKEANSISNRFLRKRSLLFLDIVKPIFNDYQEYLNNNKLIDFNDMINLATDIVNKGFLPAQYKYIIIDEFQDISMSRFKLIKAIKDKTNAKVMCVGDDWQSIYRFAGSDIQLFTQFKKYFGYYELLRIEKTYRNSQELINIGGQFVMKNKNQLKKNLLSDKHNTNPIRIFGYEIDIVAAIKRAINEVVNLYGEEAEIMILGRNNFDISVLDEQSEFKLSKDSNGQVNIKYKNYPKVKIKFLTVHRSKGLEADNVIIINLENKLVGFPNKIADDPVLSFVLTDIDNYDYAEERRLFYVAITRTKNSTYLLVPDKRGSVFVEELIKDFNIPYEMSNEEVSIKDNPNCPLCQKGYLVLRENTKSRSKFLGCSNYPGCDLTIKNVEILNNQIKCRSCGGYMVKKSSKYGEFYGCTNYPQCSEKVRIEKN